MRLFNNRLINALAKNKINEPFCKRMHDLTTPFRMQLNSFLYDIKDYYEVELEQQVIKLKKSLYGSTQVV